MKNFVAIALLSTALVSGAAIARCSTGRSCWASRDQEPGKFRKDDAQG